MKTLTFIILIMVLASCQKTEMKDVAPVNQVEYFVQSDSAYVYYNINGIEFEHYVSGWDTLFIATETLTFTVHFFSDGVCGIVLNGDTVDGCNGGSVCHMNYIF